VARAKSTRRAEARRRYRAEQGLAPDPIDDAEITGDTPTTRPAAATAAKGPVVPNQRMGIAQAFRLSFRPLDLRGDLRALPWIALHTKALWVPLALVLGSTALFMVTRGEDVLSRVFLFPYFIQTPAIGGVFIAGFLAPRASWLLGIIVGVVAAACYSLLVLTVLADVATAAPAPGLTQEVISSSFVLSPVLGALFASAAAWYRRFLAYSNPNRGRQPAKSQGNKPDGKTRTNQKAPARR
jgi:hypothetical protein